MTTDDWYKDGLALGRLIKSMRAEGDGSYDPRYDLADARKRGGKDGFIEFKRGLEKGLS